MFRIFRGGLAIKNLLNSQHYFKNSKQKKCLYQTLGVERGADTASIKKAYYKLAQQYHPDKNSASDAKEKFAEINNAYEVLSDDGRRRMYDQTGSADNQFHGFQNEDVFGGGFGGGNFDESIFSDFAQMFMGGDKKKQVKRAGQDVTMNIEIDFMESVAGTQKTITYSKRSTCSSCNGTKAKPGTTPQQCRTCQGKGFVNYRQGGLVIRMPCNACEGQGTVIKQLCSSCKGSGAQRKEVSEKISIPRGVDSNSTLRFVERGNCSDTGGKNGDLIVKVGVMKHPLFTRQGTDVYSNAKIAIWQAALGSQIQVQTIYNDKKTIKIAPGTQSGDQIRLIGDGFYRMGSNVKGNYYINVKVEIPKSLNPKEKQAFQSLKAEDAKKQEKNKS